MTSPRISPEKADKIEARFSRMNQKLGLFWTRFWACLFFVPVIPLAKTAVVMVLQNEWPSAAFCTLGAVLFGGLAVILWRRGGRYGLVEILAEKDHQPKRS